MGGKTKIATPLMKLPVSSVGNDEAPFANRRLLSGRLKQPRQVQASTMLSAQVPEELIVKARKRPLATLKQSTDMMDRKKIIADEKARKKREELKKQIEYDAMVKISQKGIPADPSLQDTMDLPSPPGLKPATRGGLQSALGKHATDFPLTRDLPSDPSLRDISRNGQLLPDPSMRDIEAEKSKKKFQHQQITKSVGAIVQPLTTGFFAKYSIGQYPGLDKILE